MTLKIEHRIVLDERVKSVIPIAVIEKLRTCVDELLVEYSIAKVGPAMNVVMAELAFCRLLRGGDADTFMEVHTRVLNGYLMRLAKNTLSAELEKEYGKLTKQTN